MVIATRLSELLSSVEEYLNTLPYKANTIYEFGGVFLHFKRKTGSGWAIFTKDANGIEIPLGDASLIIKVKSATQMAAFIEAIKSKESKILGETEEAVKVLSQLVESLPTKGLNHETRSDKSRVDENASLNTTGRDVPSSYSPHSVQGASQEGWLRKTPLDRSRHSSVNLPSRRY